MGGPSDVARALQVGEELLGELRHLRLALRGHIADLDDVQPFLAYGEETVPAGQRVLVLRIDAGPRKTALLQSLAAELAEPGGWADAAYATGAWFQVLVGGAAVPGLDRMRSPYGRVGQRQPVALPFDTHRAVEVWCVNAGPDDRTACVQAAGHQWGGLGPVQEGVGAEGVRAAAVLRRARP